MKLLFEKSVEGRRCTLLPENDVPEVALPKSLQRETPLRLPELSENDVTRHYSAIERRTFGVNNGFYPLGSCTMKYNPKINEFAAALPNFTEIHPLQPAHTMKGCFELYELCEKYLNDITGMDAFSFLPAAGAHGEFAGLLMIKKYHTSRGDTKRNKLIVPDSAHGTNPATAAMCNMKVINIESGRDGCVDLEKLRAVVGEDTAGIMLTNPNTVGMFEKDVVEISKIVHEAGGLLYYDGANLNSIMGYARPGDMGFDVVHLNLHKTFAAPHGGGGPGSGAVGCKNILKPYMPLYTGEERKESIGRIKQFYGNFSTVVKAFTYILTLGCDGLPEVSKNAVLNANYFKSLLSKSYKIAYDGICMHEFIVTLEKEAKTHDVTARDISKSLLDNGIHPPTMYFPLVVNEALMVEPTETEGKEGLDQAADVFLKVYKEAMADPQYARGTPYKAAIRRPDEVKAARDPVVRYNFSKTS